MEREAIFRSSWQIVCHVNDIPSPGDYHTFRFLGETIAVVRDQDGQIRAFHNVCRHRAARLLDGDKGRCGSRIVCPYHAWSYGLDGALLGVPHRRAFPEFRTADYPLPPVEHEIFLGFIFIRLTPGPGPSVSDMMAPYRHELAPYRFEELAPLGRVTWRPRAVNWKNVGDNYSDSLHIAVAHPGLTRLFGAGYGLEAKEWVDKMWGALVDTPSTSRSERFYQAYLPDVDHLPAERKRLWTYFKLWPNIAFDIYPDQVDFMQWLPVSPTETLVREIAYVLPDDRREMRAVRYANWRINRQVSLEDKALIERVQDGMAGSSYATGPLGLNEVSLRSFANRMRALIPESRLPQAPPPGWSHRREATQRTVHS
ncbi:aromatic ring-hydroxylating dioxygenase subunit alpha [Azospirillum sp. B4]|uniref:aromatic ring-hydroxylating oxygenase subunit alpha n=1 Tax=Azospirillum sp. B4 TaxID=95605 RepID=UPI0003454B78|nr:aromatic ring-hydroxylating dioxygenase subunit alpha [Azospirillum sp. B4]